MDFDAAPLDRPARFWVGAMTGASLLLMAMVVALARGSAEPVAIVIGVSFMPAAFLLWLAWRFAGGPVGYSLAGNRLVIHRRARSARRFHLTGEARGLGDPSRLRAESLRFGNFYGCRWAVDTSRDHSRPTVPEFNRLYVAATDLDRAVLLAIREGGGVLLTPDDPDALLQALRASFSGFDDGGAA